MMKTLFVTNHPNYCHRRFAESIDAKFYYVRHYFPDGVPLLSLPINGLVNSILVPDADVYFSESIMDYYPVYYKNPAGKKIILIAEDTLFKLDKMHKSKRNFIIKIFMSADGFIAISDLCKNLLARYVGKPCGVAYPFPHADFSRVKADIRSKSILFVGRRDPTKGYHKLVEAVKILRRHDKEWKLYLIGECGRDVRKEDGINPLGPVKNMVSYFEACSMLVHPAEFDACPATVFEAMQAGVVPLISKNIGQTKIFEERGLGSLVLGSTEPKQIAGKIVKTYSAGLKNLSKKVKHVVSAYSEPKRIAAFKKEFKILSEEVEKK